MQYAHFITSPCLNQRIFTIHTNILKYKYQMTFVSCNKERSPFNCRLCDFSYVSIHSQISIFSSEVLKIDI